MIRYIQKPINYKEFQYVDDLTEEEKKKYGNMILIAIDPGKSDLIYATNGDTKIVTKNGKEKHITTTFRYTRRQVNAELKKDKYKKNIEKDKKNTIINGKTVEKIEEELTKHNSKSVDVEKVKGYIKDKNKVHSELREYYQKDIYRRQKWFTYINRQKSEAEMINKFKAIFGKPEEVIILYGNYSTDGHMRRIEPVKGKGMRRLFRINGYKVYLVNEYNTSRKSFIDGAEMEKFRKRKNPNPEKNGEDILVHGLLRSKNGNELCKNILMNRNFNGSMNILKKGECTLKNKEIPKYLTRPKKSNVCHTSSV
jgi:nitrogen regulatory protein PII